MAKYISFYSKSGSTDEKSDKRKDNGLKNGSKDRTDSESEKKRDKNAPLPVKETSSHQNKNLNNSKKSSK